MQEPFFDAAFVEAELLAAGRTLLALHVSGVRPAGFRSGMPAVVWDADDLAGWLLEDVPPGAPTARDITHMDRVLNWIQLLGRDQVVKKRIVGARALCRPGSDRPMLSWRTIAVKVRASHEAVRLWHGQAIGTITERLNRPGLCAATGGPVKGGPHDPGAMLERALARARGVQRRESA